MGHLKGQAQRDVSRSDCGRDATTPAPACSSRSTRRPPTVTEAQTQLNGAQAAYTQQAENQLGSRQAVAVSPASIATNDRKQVAQIAILFGLLVGVLIGVAAVMALASRTSRPSLSPSWPVA